MLNVLMSKCKMSLFIIFIFLSTSTLLGGPYSLHSQSMKKEPSTNKYNVNDDTISFDNLFSHVRSISIEGSKNHPVYDITNLAVRDSLIVVLERESATLTAFNLQGTFQYQVGRPGGAPGEFTNPYWVGFDGKGRIAVLEGRGNSRIQFLDPENGQSLDVLTNDLPVMPLCDDVYFYENGMGDHRVIFPTQAPCTSSDGGLCVIQKHDVSSDSVLVRFASEKEVDKNALGVPWTLGYDGDNRMYISHVHGRYISTYNKNGVNIGKIDLNDTGVFIDIDYSNVRGSGPDAPRLVEEERSLVHNIDIVRGEVIVHHAAKSDEGMSFYISVFNKQNGKHLANTPPWQQSKHELVEVQGDRFFFVETNRESDVGSYVVHEYRYEGTGK